VIPALETHLANFLMLYLPTTRKNTQTLEHTIMQCLEKLNNELGAIFLTPKNLKSFVEKWMPVSFKMFCCLLYKLNLFIIQTVFLFTGRKFKFEFFMFEKSKV
jgi:hypothetical protein